MNPKIMLCNMPLTEEESAGSLASVEVILPPLGIGYIAAVLEKNNFDVKIIDCRPLHISVKQLIKIFIEQQPDIIGISATVLDITTAAEISKILKKELPEALLVIGGPHVTGLPENTLKNAAFDIGVIGEGELTMLEIAEQKRSGKLDVQNMRGIVYKENGAIKINAPREVIQDLDSLPFPARHLYPSLSDYKPLFGSYLKKPVAHLFTSRGCPYKCTFCDRSIFGNKFRAMSPKKVVDEMEELITVHGAKELQFYDDTFTLDKKRVYEIFDEMKRRNLKFPWSCLTRVNHVDKDILKAMRKAGCWRIMFGIESGDQRILKAMKKGTTLEQGENAVRWAKEAGLHVRASFIMGHPGETLESMNNTIKFSKKLSFDTVNFYAIVLHPGNELYDLAKKEGTIFHEDYSQYTPAIDIYKTKLAYVPEGITEIQLKQTISRAYREFYIRPSYILRQLLSIRSFADIINYAKGFFIIFKM
jgi:anaerobic magnesium-protoporphyrin IX monomethyl ester cyclase